MTDTDLKGELSQVRERLGRIETMLAERCEARCGRIATTEKDLDTLFSKVRKLEIGQAKWAGAAAVLGVALSWLLRGLGIEK